MGRGRGVDACGRRGTDGARSTQGSSRGLGALAIAALTVLVLAGCQGATPSGDEPPGPGAGGTDAPTIPGFATTQAAPSAGSSGTAAPGDTATPGVSPGATAAPAPAPSPGVPGREVGGQDSTVTGRIDKLEQQTATVRTSSGAVTVTWDGSTALLDTKAAKRADVRTGSCVVAATAVAAPGEGSGGREGVDEVVWVLVSPAIDDACATAAPQAPGASGAARILSGRVTAVKGSDVTLSTVGVGRPTAELRIALSPGATVVQTASATAAAVKTGRCVVAVGTRDAAGHVQAASLTLSDRSGGECTT